MISIAHALRGSPYYYYRRCPDLASWSSASVEMTLQTVKIDTLEFLPSLSSLVSQIFARSGFSHKLRRAPQPEKARSRGLK